MYQFRYKLSRCRIAESVAVFEEPFIRKIQDHVVTETTKYAAQKNSVSFCLDRMTLQRFLGLLILSGYKRLLRDTSYWTQSEHGYCFHADLYCGKSNAPEEVKHLSVSSQVVGKMALLLPDPHNHYQLFFDNYFTSLKLMHFLTEKGLPAIGTARECRLQR